MTARVDLKEFLSAYLEEVDEQIQAANTHLLELETLARRGEASPRLVRDLFRALHTIKGLSAMVGVEPAVAISHRLESILRASDEAGGRLDQGAFDVLLRAVRAIEDRVRELGDGKTVTPAPADLLDALDRLEGDPAASTAASASETSSEASAPELDPAVDPALDPAIVAKLAAFELDALVRAPRQGRRGVRVDFSPSPQKAERGFSINSVRERLSPIAEIVKVLPIAVPPSVEAPGALTFALLLTTAASDEDLAAAAGVEPAAVSTVTARPPTRSAPRASRLEPDDPGEVRAPPRNVVRVDVARLDDAMECLSSLIVTRSRLARAVEGLAAEGVSTRALREIMRDHARQLKDLRSAILRVRMVRVEGVLERLPLILRGFERTGGRDVNLVLETGDAELDKAVAERLFPALVHLVRNAVDHAVESPEERVAAGKPPKGTVQIRCSAESSNRLELKVVDDGRGIDRAALAKRLHEALPDTDAGLLDLVCRPGLSTRDTATTTSGRGMGMDIVRRTVVGQLGGELSLTTTAGQGTTFSLKIPVTVLIVEGFTLSCSGQEFVVPVSMVEEVIEVDRASVKYGPSSTRRAGELALEGLDPAVGLLERRGEAVPLVSLASAFHLPGERVFPRQALVVRLGADPIAFGVDRVVTQVEAVVRPLIDALVAAPGVSGATDLGDGKPTLVLDLVALGAALVSGEVKAA